MNMLQLYNMNNYILESMVLWDEKVESLTQLIDLVEETFVNYKNAIKRNGDKKSWSCFYSKTRDVIEACYQEAVLKVKQAELKVIKKYRGELPEDAQKQFRGLLVDATKRLNEDAPNLISGENDTWKTVDKQCTRYRKMRYKQKIKCCNIG
jgi:hypothetical protein